MMVKMAQRHSLAHTQARRCKVSSSPAPLTIFGWSFPPTRRQQLQASGSHTTVSHILLLKGAEDPKAFPNEWICPHFRSQTLHVAGFKRKKLIDPHPACFTVSLSVRVSIKHSRVFLWHSCRKMRLLKVWNHFFISPFYFRSISIHACLAAPLLKWAKHYCI